VAHVRSVINAHALTKSYGRRRALTELDLEVPGNVIFGYLGPNGAGKTTTIRLLAGLLRPSAGSAEVFGFDTVRQREQAQRRIGYLPGGFVAYPDMTAQQYLTYLAALRGGVNRRLIATLAERLDLNLLTVIGTMSHGNRQKVGLVQAFMHEPDLLVLDEPTTGLDPLVQREFLALLRQTRDEGRTVFLSSHILSEVEAVADVVGILRTGRLVVVQRVERLKAQALRRIELTFEGPAPLDALRRVSGVRESRVDGSRVELAVEGSTAELFEIAAPYRVHNVVTHEPDLEEVFMTYYGAEGRRDSDAEQRLLQGAA
jgi:ABC-2 type transport system ATP-binding protein